MAKKPTYEELEQRVKDLEQDVRVLKRVEGDLRETRDYLENLFNYANAPIIVWNPESRIVRFNHAFEHLTGYKDEEVIGRELSMLFPEASLTESMNKIQSTLSGEYWKSVEIPILCKNEDIRIALWNSANIYAEDGTTLLSTIAQGTDISLRKQAEGTLRESDKRYSALFDRSLDCVYIHDFEGNFIDANPAALKLFGYTKEEIFSLSFASLLSQDQMSVALQALEEIKKTGFQKDVTEFKIWTKNGEHVYLETKASLLYHEGEPYAIQGIGRDITSRKRSEEVLRESEDKYHQLFELGADALFLIEIETGQILDLNKIALEMYGYSREEALQMKNTDFSSEPDKTRQATVESESLIPVRYHRKKDGTVFPTEISVCYFMLHGKEVCVAAIRDTTERVRAEEALQESEDKYRSMMEAMKDPIYICSPDYRVEYMNPAMIQRTGRDATGEICFKALHDLEEKCPWCMHDKAQQGEYYESEIVSPKDNRSYHVSNSPIVHGDGSISKMTVFRDTTEMRETETQLQRAQKMEAMGLMAGGVAHDLNNILSGIVSYPELLLVDLPKDSPLRNPIKTIQESGIRAADVVEDLLTIARGVASGKEVLNLNTVVEGYLDSAEHQKLETIHPLTTFKTELDAELLNITGSASHVKKILMNLIVNASEAIERKGTVTVSTINRYLDEPLKGYEDVRTGEYVMLTVSDNGSGISSQDLDRIFEPFYTKKVMGRSGTGLGLAVVWNSMQDHNGYINVNTSDKGTVFELYFPVIREEVAAEKEEIPPEDYLGHGEKILVVDDEERQREIAGGILTRLGYDAEAVSSGEEAIEYVKENPVDLIVLDMVMPKGINGRETYEEIIKIHPGQKAIIASGYAKTKEVDLAQELGSGKYIKKPYTLAKVGVAVKEELEK